MWLDWESEKVGFMAANPSPTLHSPKYNLQWGNMNPDFQITGRQLALVGPNAHYCENWDGWGSPYFIALTNAYNMERALDEIGGTAASAL